VQRTITMFARDVNAFGGALRDSRAAGVADAGVGVRDGDHECDVVTEGWLDIWELEVGEFTVVGRDLLRAVLVIARSSSSGDSN
jgi:hypothetical protein